MNNHKKMPATSVLPPTPRGAICMLVGAGFHSGVQSGLGRSKGLETGARVGSEFYEPQNCESGTPPVGL